MVLQLVNQIRSRHTRVGTRKLQKMLANPNNWLPINIGRDRLFTLLKQHNQLSKLHKRFKKTTDSQHRLQVFPNLIKDLKVTRANQVWVSDITYLRVGKGKFSYLFLVSDLYSRKILGYALKESLAVEGAEEALRMALRFAKPKAGFIHHSDHGVQYCSKSYLSMLNKRGALISMTGANHCYDNAVAERINGILKYEYGLAAVLPSHDAAMKLSINSIDIYNSERLHESLGYHTPDFAYSASVDEQNVCA